MGHSTPIHKGGKITPGNYRPISLTAVIGKLKEWIRNVLFDRKWRVLVNGKLSSWAEVLSRIHQGSVLGGTYHLREMVASTAKILTDDAKLFHNITLEEDLDMLINWSELGFNEGKCKVLHLGLRNPKHDYHMKGVPLAVTTEENDLGVIIDEVLKFHKHVAAAVKKSSRMLCLIRATFTYLVEVTVPRLFTILVRCHLEYGNVIWSPRFKMESVEVEKVQRRATKLIQNLRHLPYKVCLRTLKLPSLNYRGRRGDMIQIYKIIAIFQQIRIFTDKKP